jgi:hypothetical protein
VMMNNWGVSNTSSCSSLPFISISLATSLKCSL